MTKWSYNYSYNHIVASVSTLKKLKVNCVEKVNGEPINSDDGNISIRYVSLDQFKKNDYNDTTKVVFVQKACEVSNICLPEDVFAIHIIPTQNSEIIELVVESIFENNPITDNEILVVPLELTIEIKDGEIVSYYSTSK